KGGLPKEQHGGAGPRDVWYQRENVGREADTWAKALGVMIVIRDVVDVVACVQGDCPKHLREGFQMPRSVNDPEWRSRSFHDLATFLNDYRGGYQAIGPWVWCGPDGRPDHFGLPMDAAWRFVFNERCPEKVRFHAWAQFIVDRPILQRVS